MTPSFRGLMRNDKRSVALVSDSRGTLLVNLCNQKLTKWLATILNIFAHNYFSWVDDIHSKYIAFSIKMMMMMKIIVILACNKYLNTWSYHICCIELVAGWLKKSIFKYSELNFLYFPFYVTVIKCMKNISSLFLSISSNWERTQQLNLRYYELYEINHVYLSLLLCSQYFQEVLKKVKSFSAAVQNFRFLCRSPHIESTYFTGTNQSHWTSEFIWTWEDAR